MILKFAKSFAAVKRGNFASDKSGVAAVEFAFIAPVLILLFLGTLELSYAVAVDRKVSRVSSAVADLITQGESFTEDELDDILDIAARIMEPYSDSAANLKISLSAVSVSGGQARVQWSHKKGTGASCPAENSLFTVPSNIKVDGSNLLSATVSLDHEPAFSFVGYKNGSLSFDDRTIALEEQMFLRPRMGGSGIACDDCDCS